MNRELHRLGERLLIVRRNTAGGCTDIFTFPTLTSSCILNRNPRRLSSTVPHTTGGRHAHRDGCSGRRFVPSRRRIVRRRCFRRAETPHSVSRARWMTRDLLHQDRARWWLRIHIPANARPGVYRGTVTIRDDHSPTVKVPLRLRVESADAAGKVCSSVKRPALGVKGR